MWLPTLSILILSKLCSTNNVLDYDEEHGKQFLEQANRDTLLWRNKISLAEWAYASNITDENLATKLAVSSEGAKFFKDQWQDVQKYAWKTFKDPDVKRQFSKYSILGTAALSSDKYEQLTKAIASMEEIYAKAKICDFKNPEKCNLSLEPEITHILSTSNNAEELKHAWVEWRKNSGDKSKALFKEYVNLVNEAARLNNFADNGAFWLDNYETEDIVQQFEDLWQQIKPAYLQIHAFVRNELQKIYGESVVSSTAPIPAHLLGNMWAQTWSNIAKRTLPFPNKTPEDVTQEMVKQGYTPIKMFESAEEFFKSINLSPMPDTFWKNSILQKPEGRELVCHASAWDMSDGKDFRIKQCTTVDIEDFFTVHHEMGHIQYDLAYKHHPIIYREGANEGFHEAVGDTISLSVSTQKHLRKIGLLKSQEDDYESDLNHLYSTALDKIVFLPFAYTVDQFRWNIFKGLIKPENYNCEWWKLRENYQGIEPPVNRSSDGFDAGAKYHVVADVPYIRYFVSFVIQFQFHKAVCQKSGQYVPNDPTKQLHQCDIYQNTEAGKLLKNMLQLGSSKPWPDAMEAITGQRKMDASGLLEYFKPILDYIENKNKENGVHVGWTHSNKSFGCPPSNSE
ncbi:angiotensin-converting enzyme-like [Chrysoperla carnea]|uniref:angiotensin-converting enzyme-like n=1 Tax=Chrysoperla carnea TaxID=189513 RepID=UPI001D05EE59|nr:angiotensin-converting enzyme-like [Chrysoperla carnea]XP_044735592.1 angiotensin-converting enzyme-like [Chrysoperla carnea]